MPAGTGRPPTSGFRRVWPFLLPVLLMLAPMEPLWGAVQAVLDAPPGARPWLFGSGWLLLAGVTLAAAWRRSGQDGAATVSCMWEALLWQQALILLFVAVPGWKEIHAFFSPPLEPSTRWAMLVAGGVALAGSGLPGLLRRLADGSLRPRVRIGLGEVLLLVLLLSLSLAAATPLVSWQDRPSPLTYGAMLAWFLLAGGFGVHAQLEELQERRIDAPHVRAGLLIGAYFAITAYVAVGVGGCLTVLVLLAVAADPASSAKYLPYLWLPSLALVAGLGVLGWYRRGRSRAVLPRAALIVFSRPKK